MTPPVAIIGAACRFPGASTPGELWRRVREGRSAIGAAPPGRWAPHGDRWRGPAPAHYQGGFLDEVERFDADRFGVSDREAAALDPQQRLLLTVADEALARAPALDTPAVGVFVAGGQLSYMETVLGDLAAAPKETLAGNLLNMLASRIAHTFDLRGPAFTLDSACSGSLVAIHQACRALASGDCEAALVGGVNLNLTPLVHLMFERAGALSPTGTLRPFTAGGDGTLPADGVAVLVLEPLARAERRGHRPWAIVEGSAVNNCGRTLGVMTPRPEGQVAVMRGALADAGVESAAITRVEAHATGTEIGDAVEARSIDAVYPHRPERGAVKAIVGHAMGASGCASVLAAIGALAPGERAGVNGFAFGGTNAHLVLRGGEVPAEERARVAGPPAGRRYRFGAADDAVALDGWLHAVGADGALSPLGAVGPDRLLEKGRYVVTGATGGLGRVLARFLARNYRARLVLVGRREDPGWAELEALGARVTYVRADLAEASGREAVVAAAQKAFGSPADGAGTDGLFHAAGTLGIDGEDVAAAKWDALAALEALAPRLTVLFSSISAVLPGLDRGMEAYAEANRRLDSHARSEAARGRTIVSIAWAPWQDVGMAATRAEAYRARGIEPITPALGMAALVRAVAAGVPQVAVVHRSGAPAAHAVEAKQRVDWPTLLRAVLAEVGDVPAASMRDDQHLTALGIDSLAAITVVKSIEARTGRTLPTTLLFENDTLGKLAEALARTDDDDAATLASSRAPELTTTAPSPDGVELLDAQRTFLVQQQYFPALPCNVMLACTVAPGLDRAALELALDALADRHTVLATTVARRDGKWRLVPGGPRPRLEWVEALDTQALANAVLDLERGPIIRFVSDGRRLAVHGHHLLIDAWSAKLLVEGLLQLHEAIRAGETVSRAPAAETWWTAAPRLAAAPAAVDPRWAERFADGVPPVILPYDGPGEPRGPGHTVRVGLSAETTARLEALARANAVTMPALVLASYAEMLFDVSGQHDVTVRVAHGRREARIAGIEGIVGSFADSFPVRATVGDGLLPAARRFARELGETQRSTGSSSLALAALGDRSGAGPQGLTPAGFSYLGLASAPAVGGLSISGVHGASASGFTRLALVAWVFDGRLVLSYNFLEGYFQAPTVEGFAVRQRTILERAAADGGAAVDRFADRLDARLVAACLARGERALMPDLTYAGLERASAALAARIAHAAPDAMRVAVMAEPSASALVAVVAILRAGAAYVPIDPSWPDARVQEVLRASSPTLLVTTADLSSRSATLGLPVIIARADDDPSDAPASTPRTAPPAREAWVMFTSGSTGGPKGVCVSHRAALVFLAWVERLLGLTERDRFLQTSSLAFGGSIRQMFAPILCGGTLAVVDGLAKRDPARLLGLIREHRVTIYNSVPSMWSFLMDALERGDVGNVASLRWVLLGGEAVPAALVRRWQRLVPGRERGGPRVVNLYGSTETVVNATWFEVVGPLPEDEPLTPVGWPRFGFTAHLLDVEDGVGEIAIAGENADGYAGGQPGFEQHPVHGHTYRTGDRGKRHRSGALVFVGRADAQVQIYGNRVELGEIEAVLCELPGVDAAVVVHADGRLTATLEVRHGALPTAEQVRAFVASRLPAYMVPHAVRCERALERTGVGKSVRVKAGTSAAAPSPAPAAAPSAALASVATALWRTILRVDEVDPELTFFTSGGDSMMAIELVKQLEDQTAVAISPLWLHQHPTLPALIAELEKRVSKEPRGRGTVAPAPTTTPIVLPSPRPLSAVQRGFWLASTDGHGPVMTMTLPVRGPLDVEALQAAVRWVHLRHPILRATFTGPRHQPVQTVGAAEPALLEIEDLTAAPERLPSRLIDAREAPLRLDTGPLLRLKLFRLGPAEHVLAARAHHIILDAHSMWILVQEILERHARGTLADRAAPEPELGFFARPDDDGAPDPYWAAALAGAPTDAPAPAADHGHRARVQLSPEAYAALVEDARRHHSTPFARVFAALARALQDELGRDDVVLATAVTGREADPRGLAHAVGPLARGVPVRVRSRDAAATEAALREALGHAATAATSLRAALPTEAALALGRFFVSGLEPPPAPGPVDIVWSEAELRFDTASTATEVSVAAVAHRGLTLHLRGSARVARLAAALERALSPPRSALIVYAPAGAQLPITAPARVETVRTAFGDTELILLPLTERDLGDAARLAAQVRAALDATGAGTVALAGLLPSLTGLGRAPLGGRPVVLTTGHAATVVAMARTVALALDRRGLPWSDSRVGVLGFGAIGRATLELCVAERGAPRSVAIADPRFGTTVDAVLGCDLIIAATSVGRVLDVARLAPGTVVVDDSFPRAFDDATAWARMDAAGDVTLVGGGMWDVGPLVRESPFPQAEDVRRGLPVAWLPGCHAEALLLAHRPELGPTVGEVDVRRALQVARAIDALGWRVAPLHLGPRVIGG